MSTARPPARGAIRDHVAAVRATMKTFAAAVEARLAQIEDALGEADRGYVYRYTTRIAGVPLSCPRCAISWVLGDNVEVTCVVLGQDVTFHTNLDFDGELIDHGDMVASGCHSLTRCGGCGENLMDLVTETKEEVLR